MNTIERLDLIAKVASYLQDTRSTDDINVIFRSLGFTDANGLESSVTSKRVYAKKILASLSDGALIQLASNLKVPGATILPTPPAAGGLRDLKARANFAHSATTRELTDSGTGPERMKNRVFVIHGRNEILRADFFAFLRAAGVDPIEWSEGVALTGEGSPYIGDILDHAFDAAAAIVVLLTPDDEVRLSVPLQTNSDEPVEREIRLQARPNVLFEAGMAFGRDSKHTILVAVGRSKKIQRCRWAACGSSDE